jgi:aspartyl-tRNA(Asn)/glutamyl-tRNA(Gln) amidotransferase subunit B
VTPAGWEPVIGLEVHCELRTRTKLFCGCRNEFGAPPNTHVCPVCLGLPGSLPVLNRQAVELAMRIGLALGCRVQPSVFHRKNYFYPDMPKDYQISQYDQPICVEGGLELPDGSRVRIVRAHLEEDTGKTSHVGDTGRIHGAGYALVDYNRAGVPLVEIVSAPDLRSPQQARAYVAELRGILMATGASDGRMEEGSLRVDANVSVRRSGSDELGTRCEVKNLNSLRSLVRALEHEVARQVQLLEAGRPVVQETRHFDESRGVTVALRSKEEAFDYRYFPEPDLVTLAPDAAWEAEVAASLPPLPAARRRTLAGLFGVERLTGARAEQVETVLELGLDHLVLAAAEAGVDPALALARTANEAAAQAEAARKVEPAAYLRLLEMEQEGRLSATQSKTVLAELLQRGGDPAAIAEELGFAGLDRQVVAEAVAEVVAEHPEEWARFCGGEDKLAGFFTGQVMRRTKGQADGKAVAAELAARRAAAEANS